MEPQTLGRESKHARIFHGLNLLNESLDRLQDLKFRISDDTPATKADTEKLPSEPIPSLSQVLELAGNGLHEYADRLDRLIIEIRDLVF